MATRQRIRPPILPSNPEDPTGVDSIERAAMLNFTRRMKAIGRYYAEMLGKIFVERTTVTSNYAIVVNATSYTYRLDPFVLNNILNDASSYVDTILLDGGADNLWFFNQYVEVSTARGTIQEFNNLANQSPSYREGRGSAQQILSSEPYRRRLALSRARIFEEMKGLSADTKTTMARVLTDGIGRGLAPREITKNLAERAGVQASRGHTIARTEVTMALRRAIWDEDAEAREIYGLRTALLHLSALSGTTRPSHAARHGKIYTEAQVRDWYSVNANAINCKCSQRSILIDANGEPLVPGILQQAKRMKTRSKPTVNQAVTTLSLN